jgi:DNA-binding CsgD family transcriptional regulator
VAPRRWQTDRLLDDVGTLGRRGLPREEFFSEVTARLRRVIDCDAACWHTIDPRTRLLTSDAPHELIEHGVFTRQTAPAAGAQLVASEYFVEDFNRFADLAAQRVPVGILSRKTGGHPERSTRYRDLLEPSGIPFELRAAFVTRGRCWGAVHIARRDDRRDFTDADAAALAHVVGAIADGIRTSVRFDAARRLHDGTAPGMVVLNARDEVELVTPPAQELLSALRSTATPDGTPTPLLALAQFARMRPDGAGEPDAVAVPSQAGWITLHASLPEGRASGRVAIVLERAASPAATALRLEADGVTAREREIATLIAQGLTNPEIAASLVLSPYTVQDHIKSLFEKTGVSSRQELVARVFLDDYLPRISQQAPLTSGGAFMTS